MLTLTSPTHIPTSTCTPAISAEVYPDHVAYASDGGWEGGEDTLASDQPWPRENLEGGAAALLHQGCPVSVRDCQVVVVTGGIKFNVKCSELQ